MFQAEEACVDDCEDELLWNHLVWFMHVAWIARVVAVAAKMIGTHL